MTNEERAEALETIAQAFLEVQHAQSVGARWYTRGEQGLYGQVAMWVRKGQEAVAKLRAADQEGAGGG
jgi:hypothetical protein